MTRLSGESLTERWVIVLDSEPIAIGPFDSFTDADLYKRTDHERANMRTMQIVRPCRDWKRDAQKREQAND